VGDWVDVGVLDELTSRPSRKLVDGQQVLVLTDGERVFAVGNQCTHQGAGLDKGVVKIAGSVRTVTCPAHGSMFDLETGRVMRPPATKPVPVYDVKIEDGRVFVRLRGDS